MKKIVLIVILFNTFICTAQVYTSITATLTDTNGQVWANASYSASIVAPFGNPNKLTNQGTDPVSPVSGFADGSGNISLSLDDNTVITPRGSTWKFTICPNATISVCSQSVQVVHGVSMNLSGSLSADLSPIKVQSDPTVKRAYVDAEVTGGQGAIYWRTTDNTLRGFNGSTWVSIGGSGGGGTSKWSDLLAPTGNLSLNMANFTTSFNMGNSTTATTAFDITDSSTNAGTGYLFRVWTGTTSAAKAVAFCDSGTVNCVEYNGSAIFQALGAAQIIATSVQNFGPGVGVVQLGSNGAGSVSQVNTVKLTGSSNHLFLSENSGPLQRVLTGGLTACLANESLSGVDATGGVNCYNPIYNTNGTPALNIHTVIGRTTLDGSGNTTVTLTAPAAFAGTTFECGGSANAGINPFQIVHTAGGTLTIHGTAGDTIDFICSGL